MPQRLPIPLLAWFSDSCTLLNFMMAKVPLATKFQKCLLFDYICLYLTLRNIYDDISTQAERSVFSLNKKNLNENKCCTNFLLCSVSLRIVDFMCWFWICSSLFPFEREYCNLFNHYHTYLFSKKELFIFIKQFYIYFQGIYFNEKELCDVFYFHKCY